MVVLSNMTCSLHAEVLSSAFHSVLTDKAFDLPSPPAIAARESARRVLSWSSQDKDSFSKFASNLEQTLSSCFVNNCKKVSSKKERMWEKYYKIRSSDDYAAKWKFFLQLSGANASPTLYQHITDIFFNHLIQQHFPTSSTEAPQSVQSLDYNESNALRYISGYLTRSIHHKLKKTTHKLQQELCLCLAELNDVNPDELDDESNEWMNAVDRGGLKHVSNMTYMMFVSTELEFRRHLATAEQAHAIDVDSVKKNIIENDDVQFYWCMVSANWTAEVASTLLDLLVDNYMKLRGHSTASAWLEKFKRESKKSVQKSKGVRKQLLAKASSSASNKEEALDIED